jgi:hypothetical protein
MTKPLSQGGRGVQVETDINLKTALTKRSRRKKPRNLNGKRERKEQRHPMGENRPSLYSLRLLRVLFVDSF